MTVGFIELTTTRQPDHLFSAEVIAEPAGHLVLAQVSVAIAVKQALFGGQQGALAIGLDTAHFSDKGRAIAIIAFDFEDLLRNLIILVPRVVEPAIKTTVGVELEVHTAYFAAVVIDQKGWAAVAKPGVVAGHFHHPYMGRQLATGIGVLAGRGAYSDRLAAGNCRDDIHPNLLRRLGTVAPHVGAFRPAEPAAGLGFEFAGQTEAIGFRERSQGTRHRMHLMPVGKMATQYAAR